MTALMIVALAGCKVALWALPCVIGACQVVASLADVEVSS